MWAMIEKLRILDCGVVKGGSFGERGRLQRSYLLVLRVPCSRFRVVVDSPFFVSLELVGRIQLARSARSGRLRGGRDGVEAKLPGEEMRVVSEDEVDALANVDGDRHLGAIVQELELIALLGGHVDCRRDLL